MSFEQNRATISSFDNNSTEIGSISYQNHVAQQLRFFGRIVQDNPEGLGWFFGLNFLRYVSIISQNS